MPTYTEMHKYANVFGHNNSNIAKISLIVSNNLLKKEYREMLAGAQFGISFTAKPITGAKVTSTKLRKCDKKY